MSVQPKIEAGRKPDSKTLRNKKKNDICKFHIGPASFLNDIPEAPVYRPSPEEFADPIAYIRSIQQDAAQWGICKIIPPVSPAIPGGLALVREDAPPFKFDTREQYIRHLKWDALDKARFYEGKKGCTVKSYEREANEFAQKRFGTSGVLPSRLVEAEYWREMEGSGPPARVLYGNDVEGSAFCENPTLDPLSSTRWNLQVLPKDESSTLRLLAGDVPGVTSPMLYIGMLFATFAWHVEDHYLYSINYQHLGAAKTWYGVPAAAADGFEGVVKDHVYRAALQAARKDGKTNLELDNDAQATMIGKTTMFSPKLLLDNGVRVCRAVQAPGEFVVTFPRAYHAGFSNGFCIGEAVNFGIADWFPFAADAAVRYRRLRHLPILPQEQLLCQEAAALQRLLAGGGAPGSGDGELLARDADMQNAVMDSFVRLVRERHLQRQALLRRGWRLQALAEGISLSMACSRCKDMCYLGAVIGEAEQDPICLPCAVADTACSTAVVHCRSDIAALEQMAREFEGILKERAPACRTVLGEAGLTEHARFGLGEGCQEAGSPQEPFDWSQDPVLAPRPASPSRPAGNAEVAGVLAQFSQRQIAGKLAMFRETRPWDVPAAHSATAGSSGRSCGPPSAGAVGEDQHPRAKPEAAAGAAGSSRQHWAGPAQYPAAEAGCSGGEDASDGQQTSQRSDTTFDRSSAKDKPAASGGGEAAFGRCGCGALLHPEGSGGGATGQCCSEACSQGGLRRRPPQKRKMLALGGPGPERSHSAGPGPRQQQQRYQQPQQQQQHPPLPRPAHLALLASRVDSEDLDLYSRVKRKAEHRQAAVGAQPGPAAAAPQQQLAAQPAKKKRVGGAPASAPKMNIINRDGPLLEVLQTEQINVGTEGNPNPVERTIYLHRQTNTRYLLGSQLVKNGCAIHTNTSASNIIDGWFKKFKQSVATKRLTDPDMPEPSPPPRAFCAGRSQSANGLYVIAPSEVKIIGWALGESKTRERLRLFVRGVWPDDPEPLDNMPFFDLIPPPSSVSTSAGLPPARAPHPPRQKPAAPLGPPQASHPQQQQQQPPSQLAPGTQGLSTSQDGGGASAAALQQPPASLFHSMSELTVPPLVGGGGDAAIKLAPAMPSFPGAFAPSDDAMLLSKLDLSFPRASSAAAPAQGFPASRFFQPPGLAGGSGGGRQGQERGLAGAVQLNSAEPAGPDGRFSQAQLPTKSLGSITAQNVLRFLQSSSAQQAGAAERGPGGVGSREIGGGLPDPLGFLQQGTSWQQGLPAVGQLRLGAYSFLDGRAAGSLDWDARPSKEDVHNYYAPGAPAAKLSSQPLGLSQAHSPRASGASQAPAQGSQDLAQPPSRQPDAQRFGDDASRQHHSLQLPSPQGQQHLLPFPGASGSAPQVCCPGE